MPNQFTVYKCKRCRHNFAAESSLRRHRAIQKKTCVGYLYTCKRCLKSFNTEKQVYSHQLDSKECKTYIFENKVQQRNRVVVWFNIGEVGYKSFVTKILTPVLVNKVTEETRLNLDMIKLVYDSLSVSEFMEMVTYTDINCPALKLSLMASLKFYLKDTTDAKAEKIKQFFESNRCTSFE